MHPYLFVPSILLSAILVNASHAGAVQPTSEATADTLRSINHRMLDSRYGARDDFARSVVADDFFGIGRDGNWLDKSGFERILDKRPTAVEISYDNIRLRLFDGFALIEGVVTVSDGGRKAYRVRYSNSYAWQGYAWLLVGSQETQLSATADSDIVSQAKPADLGWVGDDPLGDDDVVLESLNASYVDAFRRADAGWFDAHLDDDYVVTFGDGSFHDRGDALADFQIPYFDKNIRSFPVGAVRIRKFGGVAMIHAENDYELKDGRKGINRYTDIWRKTDRGWKCISAHITVFKPAV